MTTSTARQTFRETVALVATAAKAKLPQAVNGRVEAAVALVLAGDVFFQDDGTVQVGSARDPQMMHTVHGTSCSCADNHFKAPAGWCKHRIAVAIATRVGERMAAQAAPAPPVEIPEKMDMYPDNDAEDFPEAPEPLP